MPAIENAAMIVRLTIKTWNPLKKDTYVTNDVNSQYNSKGAGYWNKWCIAKDAIDGVRKIANQARNYHYKNTLPWQDGGDRLLPSTNFLDYSAEMRAMKASFEAEAQSFCSNYMNAVNEAQQNLGTMFNSTDYPSASEIDSYFSFDTANNPVPVADDFRCELNAEDMKEVKAKIEAQTQEAVTGAVDELWNRLEKVIDNAAEALSTDDKVFRDTLIGNIDAVVEMIPKLNFTDDKTLENLAKEARDKVAQFSPKFLRKNKDARKKIASEAKAVAKKIKSSRPPRKNGKVANVQ